MSWSSDVVDRLCQLKRTGCDFDTAWRLAVQQYPTRSRDRIAAGEIAEDLFEAARVGRDEESASEFLHRVAADAWHGRNPGLRRIGMLREMDVFPDEAVPVFQRAQVGRNRAAA